ncbi:hypothetical protein GCM10020258_27750 [Sphingomonas yabuuchiae]
MAKDQLPAQAIPSPQTAPPLPSAQTNQPLATGETIGAIAPEDPQLAQPLTPLSSFDTTPLDTMADAKGQRAPDIRYDMEVRGLAELKLDDEFKGLSALREGKGKAANATQVSARAREDEQLAIRLMKSLGYYDATAISTLQREGAEDGEAGRLKVVLTATPGRLYRLSSITVNAQPTVPTDLIRSNLPLKVGDAIEAARIEGRRPMSVWSCPSAAIPSSRWDSATSCWRIRGRSRSAPIRCRSIPGRVRPSAS